MSWAERALRGVLPAVAVLVLGASPAAAVTARPWVETDATGPLVEADGLAPGELAPACITVSWSGAEQAVIVLSATVAGTGLAEFLDVRVEEGAGGGYGDCAAFTGRTVFAGSLAELGAGPPDPASMRAFPAGTGDGSVTYRFTFALRSDDAAQGLTTSADLVWYLMDAPPPLPTPPPPPPAAPGPGPGRTADPASDQASSAPTSGPPSVGATTGEAFPDAGAPLPGAAPSASRASAPDPEAEIRASTEVPMNGGGNASAQPTSPPPWPVSREGIAGVIAEVAPLMGFPFLLALLVAAYLAVQDRLDRGDPKLALAPLHADPNLPFIDDDAPRRTS